jgi:hypothetical protein
MVDGRERAARVAFGALLIAGVAACGGESRSTRNDDALAGAGTSGSSSGGNGGTNAGASGGSAGTGGHGGPGGGQPDVPYFEGVPVGDCQERTPEELTMLGCPPTAPEESAACDLAEGVTCPYAITAAEGRSSQELFLCSKGANRQWWSLDDACGRLCSEVGQYSLELDASDCGSRAPASCEPPDTEFAYAPSAFTQLSYVLGDIIDGCAPGTVNFGASLSLEHGCPTHLSTTHAFSPEELACLKAELESQRYVCGDPVPCTETSKYLAI